MQIFLPHPLICPTLNDNNIPQRTCLGSTVAEKFEKLDEIDCRIIAVSPFTSIFSHFMYNYISFRTSHHSCHWWQTDGLQSVATNFHYSLSSISMKLLICLDYGHWRATPLNSSTLLGIIQELEWVRNLLKLSWNLGFGKRCVPCIQSLILDWALLHNWAG